MQVLIFFVIGMVMTFDYLVSLNVLPGMVRFGQELSSAAVIPLVIALGVRTRFQNIRAVYWLVFASILLVMVCGALANQLGSGPLFAGIRTYFRAIPFFFLPAVAQFSERQIRQQLTLLGSFCVLQLPLAIYQRNTTLSHVYGERGRDLSGDQTFGTLMDSGTLSIFLICAVCILLGALSRKEVGWPKFVVLFLLFLVPTMINETKVTLFILPASLLAVMIFGAPRAARLKHAALAVVMISAFAAIFIPVYDYYMKPRWGYGIVDFLTMPGRVEGYISQGGQVGSLEAGRLDGILVAMRELPKDPAKLLFGLGIGNASESSLGLQFVGSYFQKYGLFTKTTFNRLLFEIGCCGVALVFVLYHLIFRDAQFVAEKASGIWRAVAVGWLGVIIVMIAATFYVRTLDSPALAYLFWYFSGALAAERMKLASSPLPVIQLTETHYSQRNPARAID